ncbi:MAG: Smr/MutS family protein [Cytophagales bacterium]
MNIGDRVRMIRDRQEGVVTKIIDDKLVEIRIDEGFTYPVLRQELAIVYREEAEYFETDRKYEGSDIKIKDKTVTETKTVAATGLFLAFELIDKNELKLYLINNTDFNCPFSVSENMESKRRGIESGHLFSKSYAEIQVLKLDEIEKWPEFEFAILFSRKGEHNIIPPFLKTYKFRSKRFFREAVDIPLLKTKGYFFQIDQDNSDIDADMLKEHLAENIGKTDVSGEDIQRPDAEIDLHFEALWPNAPSMENFEILKFQLDHFEKMLDNAIYSGMNEITFIHGVGNGKLRMEMHRILSKHNNIKSFKDAQKEKFGYGATLVRIK